MGACPHSPWVRVCLRVCTSVHFQQSDILDKREKLGWAVQSKSRTYTYIGTDHRSHNTFISFSAKLYSRDQLMHFTLITLRGPVFSLKVPFCGDQLSGHNAMLTRVQFLKSIVVNYICNLVVIQYLTGNLVSCWMVKNDAFEKQGPRRLSLGHNGYTLCPRILSFSLRPCDTRLDIIVDQSF